MFESIELVILDDCEISHVSSSMCYMYNLFWIYSMLFITSKLTEKNIYVPSSEVWIEYYNNFFDNIDSNDYYNLIVYFTACLICKNQKNLSSDIASAEFFKFCMANMTDKDKNYFEINYSKAPFDTRKYYDHVVCMKTTGFSYSSDKKKFLDVCRFNYECESDCCLYDDYYDSNICVTNQECNSNYYDSI
jgi:hypothetical protein